MHQDEATATATTIWTKQGGKMPLLSLFVQTRAKRVGVWVAVAEGMLADFVARVNVGGTGLGKEYHEVG